MRAGEARAQPYYSARATHSTQEAGSRLDPAPPNSRQRANRGGEGREEGADRDPGHVAAQREHTEEGEAVAGEKPDLCLEQQKPDRLWSSQS